VVECLGGGQSVGSRVQRQPVREVESVPVVLVQRVRRVVLTVIESAGRTKHRSHTLSDSLSRERERARASARVCVCVCAYQRKPS